MFLHDSQFKVNFIRTPPPWIFFRFRFRNSEGN